ncbi:MAG: S9 family peptidase [Gemmatimonadetes bacterium]|nr:S9 family peptidase [Gemmatimonadota bacterium]
MNRLLIVVFVASVAFPASALAQQNMDVLTAEDVFDLEFVSDPQVSPDGSQIVFVRQWSDPHTDRNFSNLWIMNDNGSGQRSLTTGKQADSWPRWSPDGQRLLYLSDETGTPQLHVRWMDTGATTRITNLAEEPRVPAWSPDGSMIVYSSFVPQAGMQLISMPDPPEGVEWAEPARVIHELVHRFDGAGDLEHGFTHLFVIPSDGGTPRRITSGDFHHGGYVGRSGRGRPVWSPDGASVLIEANRHPDWELENRNTEIYEISLDGEIRALTDRKGPDGGVAVSPDGRRIAYTGFDDRYQGYQVTGLYMANRDGSGAHQVAAQLDRTVGGLAWSPDSGRLYFSYADMGNTRVAYVEPGSDEVHIVAEDMGGSGSAYGGGSFSVGPDGMFAYTTSTPTVMSELAVGGDGGDVRIVTAVNEDVLGHKTLGAVEELWWPSSHDGLDIHGWIIKPPGFDPSRRYPLILEIHGGPFANYGDRFDIEKQSMASAGYVVLYTNPRGSTSYGEEFGNLIHHSYPGNDYYDLDSGVDAVIELGYVDPEQLYITGGSGGGVLSSWSIGMTDRYKAAAVLYPVINWYSFAVSADIPITVSKYWFPSMPWEDPEHYMSRSPISLVGNVTTPTMVMTGVEDYRTPMSESDQYFQALKLEGVEAVLVKVPGEPHGIRVRPSHFMQKIKYIVGWFDRYRGMAS